MPSILKCVPENVARYVQRAMDESDDEKSKERLRRLISGPDMEAVWLTLSKEAPSPEVLENFAGFAASNLWLIWGRRLLPPLTNAAQRGSLARIGRLSSRILDELAMLSGSNRSAARGVAMIAGAVYRAELGAVAANHRALPELASLRVYLSTPGVQQALVAGLSALASAARHATKARQGPGPRKLAARTAVRTAYVLELDSFLKAHFKKPLYAVIATTANVMLEEYEKPLTAAHVRKLIHPPKKISSKSRP